MNDIVFRPLESRDYPHYRQLINEAWNTADYIKNPAALEAALDSYMRLGLLGATYTQIAEKNGIVLGIIVASAKGQPSSEGFLKRLCHCAALAGAAIRLPFCSASDRHNLLSYMGEFSQYKKLLGGRKNRYDCSIDFFVMSEKNRGQGIGKMLLGGVFAYFRDCGARRVYLFTDTWCNYGFYDSQGFTCTARGDVPSEGIDEGHKVFLYEKEV